MAEQPEFISADSLAIVADWIASYEAKVGRKLQPAEVEVLLANTYGYRETVTRSDANAVACQNLIRFSTFPVLDELVKLVGIEFRLPKQNARVTIEFTLNGGHPNLVIQAGTRVSHQNGTPIFEVEEDTLVLSGVNTIEIECVALEAGLLANGFGPGSINVLLDTFTHFISCTNVNTSAGGSEEESDEQLRARAMVAPEAYSSAGPLGAYEFHARSAHPSIIDVKVEGPEVDKDYPPAGTVAIFVLTSTIPVPQQVLDAVIAACNNEKKIPVTDTVVVEAATAVDYSIEGAITLYKGADDTVVLAEINAALEAYKNEKVKKLGQDIVMKQVHKLVMVEGVYDFDLTSILTNIAIGPGEFANCTLINLTIAGYTNG